jgi:hypothetical protein
MSWHTIYDLFGLNYTLFFTINGARGVMVDYAMLLGTRLGDFWNLPWVVGVAVFMATLKEVFPDTRCIRRLPERRTMFRFLLVLLIGYALAGISVELLKEGVHMPRPSAAMPAAIVHVIGKPATGYNVAQFRKDGVDFPAQLSGPPQGGMSRLGREL